MAMFGEKICKYRDEKDLTQLQLAKMIGITRHKVLNYEKQAYPPLDFIVKSLKVLKPGMRLFEFFAEEGELDKYLPSWITEEDAYALHFINGLDREHQVFFKKTVNRLLKFIARYVGKDFQELNKF